MWRLNAGLVARFYLVVVLLLAVLVSPLLQLCLALALLAVQLFCMYRPLKAGLNLIFAVASLLLAPLAVESLVGPFLAVLLVAPAIVMLDSSLRSYAATRNFSFSNIGRSASTVLKSLAVCLGAVFLFSLLTFNLTLVLADAVLLVYLVGVLLYVILRVPKTALDTSNTWSRIVVGDTDSKLVTIKTKAHLPTKVFLKTVAPWVKAEPEVFNLEKGAGVDTTLRFTPSLAGPSKVALQAAVVDSRGLTVTGQVLQPVDLHIIPRAAYAKWLANKFLEQTAQGLGPAPGVPKPSSPSGKAGVEFNDTHPFQPGDNWRNIDWKHTYMLGELIVKEFSDAQGQVGIIVADLTAKDAEEADKLAYNLVMSSLTLAEEALPAGLAVYNNKEVLAVTSPTSSRETLKKSIELTDKISIVEAKERVLQPVEMRRLKRSIGQLSQTETPNLQRLREVLEFESAAYEEAAKEHPAAKALMQAAKLTRAPAVFTVASPVSSGSDVLLLTLEKLHEKGYSTIMVA